MAAPAGPAIYARALYAYKAQSSTELDVSPNDIIKVIQKYENGWWVGESNGNMGVFPGAYVKELSDEEAKAANGGEPEEPPTVAESESEVAAAVEVDGGGHGGGGGGGVNESDDGQGDGRRRVRAIKDHTAKHSAQLSFKQGEVIVLIDQFPTGWWKGDLNGHSGLFPRSHVELMSAEESAKHAAENPQPSSSTPSAPTEGGEKYCVAKFDYKGLSKTELSFKAGERIKVLAKLEKGWWKGELEGVVGHFPGNYVTEDTDASGFIRHQSSGTFRRVLFKATALYNFDGVETSELSMNKGDSINVLACREEGGWWKGELNGSIGHFPANYVKKIEEDTVETKEDEDVAPTLPERSSPTDNVDTPQSEGDSPSSELEHVRALYAFAGRTDTELSFNKGDTFALLDKTQGDGGWWRGRIGDKVGHFPSQYVTWLNSSPEEVPPSPTTAAPAVAPEDRHSDSPPADVEKKGEADVGSTPQPTSAPGPSAVGAHATNLHAEDSAGSGVETTLSHIAAGGEEREAPAPAAAPDVGDHDEHEEKEGENAPEDEPKSPREDENTATEEETAKQDEGGEATANADEQPAPSEEDLHKRELEEAQQKAKVALEQDGDSDAKSNGDVKSSGSKSSSRKKTKKGSSRIKKAPSSSSMKKKRSGSRSSRPLPDTPDGRWVKAMYDYQGRSETELSYKEGEEILMISPANKDGWAKGILNNRTGHFPFSFVQLVDEKPKGATPSRRGSSRSTYNKSRSKDKKKDEVVKDTKDEEMKKGAESDDEKKEEKQEEAAPAVKEDVVPAVKEEEAATKVDEPTAAPTLVVVEAEPRQQPQENGVLEENCVAEEVVAAVSAEIESPPPAPAAVASSPVPASDRQDDGLAGEVAQLRLLVQEMQKQLLPQEQGSEALKAQLANDKKERVKQDRAIAGLERELSKLRTDLDTSKTEYTSLKADVANAAKSGDNAIPTSTSTSSYDSYENSASMDSVAGLRSALEEERRSRRDLEAMCRKMESEMGQMKRTVDRLKRDVEEKTSDIAKAPTRLRRTGVDLTK
eukprot:TRINITY_DN1437_c2_g2_i2.p1 TRINITY_DN1437_c2_g2~~TRINITY_DN1437_c2_g2_i2.p1  ORF type:complete len:1039 (+),score=282.22 TRINITY_DN1437_c2_g2_i2:209-3325(+)